MKEDPASLRCVLVDDEPLARERLRTLLAETATTVEVVGEAGSGHEAVPLIHRTRPDVVFLDVQMPVLDGFDVVDLLAPPRPAIVFVTAYDAYALRAFEVHALDYLTKPVRLARLERALQWVTQQTASAQAAMEALLRERQAQPLRRLTVQRGRRLRVVDLDEVRWIAAEDKLVHVHLKDGTACPIDYTLDALENRLDPAHFIRIHRSHLVNAAAVRELIPWFSGTYHLELDNGHRLPVARRRVQAVKQWLGGRG